MISPQLVCAALRGLAIGVMVGIVAVIAIPTFVTSMSGRQMVATFATTAIPVWLGFLGFGGYDTHRDNTGKVLPSDVQPTAPAAVARG